jgi:hypothetical protein
MRELRIASTTTQEVSAVENVIVANKVMWKGTETIDEAVALVDQGILLRWSEMRTLKRNFQQEEQIRLVRHFAIRLAERARVRLQAEILVESVLIWLANTSEEFLLNAFLEELFAQGGFEDACMALVEISLTNEVAENNHDEDIFAMAVALICELGINLREYDRRFPNELRNSQAILDHIATYLLSVSNSNNTCIRLSLLHYFGVVEKGTSDMFYFNRIMSRFGHTVLDHLFTLLFKKRSEAVALVYLLENLPFVLSADRHSQKIVHETFKYYMLKQPERFSLFVQAFSDHLTREDLQSARQMFMQHLGALLKVVSDLNHKLLGREFLVALTKFEQDPFCDELVRSIMNNQEIRRPFRELLQQLHKSDNRQNVVDSVAQFRSSKRGRKPSFAKADNVGTMHQVTYLGSIDIPKAS